MLTQLHRIPPGLLEAAAENLHRILPGPTLIHLEGRSERPLFVSVLLHGNESTGLLAIQSLLRKYADQPLPRSLSIFFGNMAAARLGLRRLDGQCDYNRVWPGTELAECEETRMAQTIVEEMKHRQVFASVDIHNNTGLNPHYACVNRLEHRYLQLASLFGRLVVYFTYPKGVQSAAFAPLCPAVTLECGKPGHHYGFEHAFEFLDACLHLSEIPDHPVPHRDVDLFHTVGKVSVREGISFGFGAEDRHLNLHPDLDHQNFTEVPAGTVWGQLPKARAQIPVAATAETGEDVTKEYFLIEADQLTLKKTVMPSMLTLDERIIRQDCLCYLMERISLPSAANPPTARR